MTSPYSLDTPSRVLKRVQQMEDMELPSLPSFQHDDLDFDSLSAADTTRADSQDTHAAQQYEDEDDMATPHPLRQVMNAPPPASTASNRSQRSVDSFSTASGSPYPPTHHQGREETPSPYAPTAALTSTPHSRPSRSQSRSLVASTATNNTAATKRERWQTPGELSTSFSADEIPPSIILGSEKSVPLNDPESSFDDSQVVPELPSLMGDNSETETPTTRRLSNSNVQVQRPRRRAFSNVQAFEAIEEAPTESSDPPTPHHALEDPAQIIDLLEPAKDRIPSLSRSEVTGTDHSVMSTPEGPIRNVSMMTPREDAPGEYEVTDEYNHHPESQEGNATMEYQQEYEYTPHLEDNPSDFSGDYGTLAKTFSSGKHIFSVSDATATPATIKAIPRDDGTNAITATPVILQDVTDTRQNTPFTPSPNNTPSSADFETPRAPLDDAQRRKSHVLAVLNSTAPPSRMRRSFRGTPHPLRRVSTAPLSESIAEEVNGAQDKSLLPGMLSRLTDASGNESFISIASSADLTTDGRAHHRRISRGNTSFPILSMNPSASSGSLKGLGDHRAPNSKIIKHINEMNKQLLETNADLAREAEAWRDEVDRLHEIMRDKGIDVEVDIEVGSQNLSRRRSTPPRHPPARTSVENSSARSELIAQLSMRTDQSLSEDAQDLLKDLSPAERAAVVQEMAERLEGLEEELNKKEQIIADMRTQGEDVDNSQVPGSEAAALREEIEELSHQLDEAEKSHKDLQAQFTKRTEEHREKFSEICSELEAQVKSLVNDLSIAREETERLKGDKVRLEEIAGNQQSSDREEQLRKHVWAMESDLDALRVELKGKSDSAKDLENRVGDMEKEGEELKRSLEEASHRVNELDHMLDESEDRVERGEQDREALSAELKEACFARTRLEDELSHVQRELQDVHEIKEQQQAQLEDQQMKIQQLYEAVHELEAQGQNEEDQRVRKELDRVNQDLAQVNDLLKEKEGEVQEIKRELESLENKSRRSSQRSNTTATLDSLTQSSVNAALEERLDAAYREITRLKEDINASPHRRSTIEVRDLRIQALEREKAVLTDRLAQGRKSPNGTPVPTSMSGRRSAMLDAGSPFKRATPAVSKSIASLRGMKTPGATYDPSWLQTTVESSNASLLEAQLEYLQEELQAANHQLDNNFDRLEAAGLDAVELAEKLAQAQDRIGELEDEIRGLLQENKDSLALVGAEKEEQEREAENRLAKALSAVHNQMNQLQADIASERARLQANNTRLQDFVSEMRLKSNAEVKSFKAEMGRMAEDTERVAREARGEVEKAERERDGLGQEIHTMESRIAQLERELADERRAYDSLSRRNAQTTRDSPVLTQLQDELKEKAQIIRSLESSFARLRESLAQREQALCESQARIARYQHERGTVAHELGEFEKDLAKHRKDSDEFGRELQLLKRETLEKSEQHAAEVRILERDLKDVKEREKWARRDLEDIQRKYGELEISKASQLSTFGPDALAEQKTRFKAQSRELAAQIRYLKAKYTRESTFRNALALQKRYLLLLVGGKSLNEHATIKAIANMGFPVPEPPRPSRTLKAVALAVLSTVRARNSARHWRAEVDQRMMSVVVRGERRRVSSRT